MLVLLYGAVVQKSASNSNARLQAASCHPLSAVRDDRRHEGCEALGGVVDQALSLDGKPFTLEF